MVAKLFAILVFLQSILAAQPVEYEPYSLVNAREFAAEIQSLYIEEGFADKTNGYVINSYDPEAQAWKRFPPSYILTKISNATKKPVNKIVETFEHLFAPPPYWRGATDICSREILMNPQWNYTSFPWYNDIAYIDTVAHELAHIQQNCGGPTDTWWRETNATLMGMEVLAAHDSAVSHYALLRQLETMGTIIYWEVKQGNDPYIMLNKFGLEEPKYSYFEDYAKQCLASFHMCELRAMSYFTRPLIIALYDIDGFIDKPDTATGVLHIDDLQAYLYEQLGQFMPISYSK